MPRAELPRRNERLFRQGALVRGSNWRAALSNRQLSLAANLESEPACPRWAGADWSRRSEALFRQVRSGPLLELARCSLLPAALLCCESRIGADVPEAGRGIGWVGA